MKAIAFIIVALILVAGYKAQIASSFEMDKLRLKAQSKLSAEQLAIQKDTASHWTSRLGNALGGLNLSLF